MVHSIPKNMAVMTVSGTPGTGTITLGSAVTGFATFAEAGVANLQVVSYRIQDGDYFEVGQGVYTSSGTTLSRDTVRLAKDGGGADTNKISVTSAATVELVIAAEDHGLQLIDYEEFTSNDTWSKPTGAVLVFVQVVGGGGSGSAGNSNTNSAVRSGGGAGGAGSVRERWFAAAALDSTESVTVGATATGPSGVTTGNGTAGTKGNASDFGGMLIAPGGGAGAGASTASAGGTAGVVISGGNLTISITSGTTVNIGSSSQYPGVGGAGGTASAAGVGFRGGIPEVFGGPGGGGGGGGVNTTDALSDPGAGGDGYSGTASSGIWYATANASTVGSGGAAGTSNASSPVAGTNGADGTSPYFGAGGGGGGASISAAAGAGGAGGTPGGGGGGGGGTRNAIVSGAGGNGARGTVRVWTYG